MKEKWSLCLNIKTSLIKVEGYSILDMDTDKRSFNQLSFLNEVPVSLVLSFTECNADEVLAVVKMSAAGQCISKLPFILADCAG